MAFIPPANESASKSHLSQWGARMQKLTDIAIFVEVVRRLSFTAAAESLEMSQPVVSKAVTRLEDRLGARLLNRTTRRLSLTEAGANLYRRSAQALGEIDNAELEV